VIQKYYIHSKAKQVFESKQAGRKEQIIISLVNDQTSAFRATIDLNA